MAPPCLAGKCSAPPSLLPTSETCNIWDTDYNSDNWEPEFMTIFVTWQLIVTLDSIRNSCDVIHIDSTNYRHKHRKNCKCCPAWLLIVRSQRWSELRFSIVRILISVSNVTSLQDCLFNCENGKSNCLNCENCRQLSSIVKKCQNCKQMLKLSKL